ncbi:MAG TPA: hypothetical protein VKK81_03220 [Candidatus Binatia bacterium]|nr:hypothetical protein [Candidatus Binatia bacterium]
MKLKPYSEYKDSGLPWLGKIPAHWGLLRSKYIFHEVDIRSKTGEETHLSMSQIHGLVESSKVEGRRLQSESYIGGKLCNRNDLVLNRLKAHLGVFAHAPQGGVVSPDYSVFRMHRDGEVRFFETVFRTPTYVAELRRSTKGIVEGFWRLYTDDSYNIRVPVPPIDEQRMLLRWIDHFDRSVRHSIRAKRRLIALLNEQKQAIIHRAVTRGLDPNVRLKPSGVEWLPEIPEHWISVRAGTLASSLQTGPFGSQLHAHEYKPNGTPVINPSHMTNGRIAADPNCAIGPDKAAELSRHRLRPGDIVFARRGELGRCALVGKQEAGWLCGTGSLRMRLKDQIADLEYLLHLQSG